MKKSKRIKLYLTRHQKRILTRWFGASRFLYNKTVALLKNHKSQANWKALKTELIQKAPEWAKDVPYQIKSLAVKDACDAVKAAKRKFKVTGKFNEVKFRRRKAPKQSIYVPKSAVKDRGVYHTLLGKIRYAEKLPDDICDSRLVFLHGMFYLSVPYSSPTSISENQGRVVAIDPGVRTFTTFFSEDNCGKLGISDFSRIQRLCSHLDNLISRQSKATHCKKQRMQRAVRKMRLKLKDLIEELHFKTALFFVKNFDVILLPTFETSNMTTKAKRKIRSKTVRNLLSFAFYKFSQILEQKAFEYGKTVLRVSEAYTSQTCSWNGEMKKIGSAKKIKDGNTVLDRDMNSARGILIRWLCEITPLLTSA